jgi:dipeptidyl aminopeptidase/acylaminoacyl peptidase
MKTSYKMNRLLSIVIMCTVCLGAINTLFAQETSNSNALKQLTRADYDQWQRLGWSTTVTEDGNWLIYSINKNNGDTELHLNNLQNSSEKVFQYASKPAFSKDNKWLCYKNGVSGKESKKLKKDKKPVPNKITLRNLVTGDSLEFKEAKSFEFSGKGLFLAMSYAKLKEKKSAGSDLVIRNLATGQEFNFGNVSDFKWQDEGELLAMIIDADNNAGNGVQLFDPISGNLKVLDSKDTKYENLNWRKKSNDLVFSRVEEDSVYEEDSYSIHVWKGLGTKATQSYTFNHAGAANFPVDYRIVDTGAIKWSKDGETVFFNIFNRIKKPAEVDENLSADSTITDTTKVAVAKVVEEAPELEIWHSNDAVIIPAQKKSSKNSSKTPYLVAYHFKTSKFIQLEDELTEAVNFQDDSSVIIGTDATPYEFAGMFGRGKVDGYVIDIKTGKKTKLTTGASSIYAVDPTGSNVVFAKDNQLFLKQLISGKELNLTEGLEASFFNTEDDHPVENFRTYSYVIDWEKSGKSFFINSKYDVWQFSVDGSKKRNLTNGKADKIIYRYNNLDQEADYVDTKKPLFLRMSGELSKKSGYAQVSIGKTVTQLIWQDANLNITKKVKGSNKIIYSKQTYSDSPDLFATADYFKTNKQLSATNPFQKDYMWGKAELIEYTNKNGLRLQGILYYPADYEAGKKYPMITYIYEKLSRGYHSYSMPSKTSYYNTTVFTTNGYFVLKPDIIFDAGDPGVSSTTTLEIAVKTVVDMGLVDQNRVGLVGHSWGGYQAAYVPTQTDIFAASVAGAGLTNLISMYGAVTPAFGGQAESGHFEVSQERMVNPPWLDADGYIRNSPVMNIDKLNTPMLFEVGSDDMNVNRRQGVEYYNAARRAGKQFVLLQYAKEGHGLRHENNQMDYQNRILSWFGHYLKDEPAEDWIKDGIPYDEQQRQLKNWPKK